MILAELRSGYQYLATSLNSHPKAFCFGEIFGSDREIRKKSLFRKDFPVLEDNQSAVKYMMRIRDYGLNHNLDAIGFKLNYVDGMHNEAWKPMWEWLVEHKWSIIHLTRRNLLNRLLSERLAQRHDSWQNTEYDKPIVLDPKDFFFCQERSLQWQQWARHFFRDNPLMELEYEDLENSHETVQTFLNMKEIRPLTPGVRQQRVLPQWQMIHNYRQIHAALQETKWAHYLEGSLFL